MKTRLFELSPDELTRSTVAGFPNTKARQHLVGSVSIGNVKYTPYVKNFTLRIDATANSNGHTYQPTILVKGVFYDKDDSQDVVAIKSTNGEDYYIYPIHVAEPDAETRCTCLDFYWRFANTNNANDSLYGKPPPPYRKKTNRPPVNPQGVPGMCKHLLKLVDVLKQTRVATG